MAPTSFEVPVDLAAPYLHLLVAYQSTERFFTARRRAGKQISTIKVSTIVRDFDNIIRVIRECEDLPYHPKFKVTFSASPANFKEFWASAAGENKELASAAHQYVTDKLDMLRSNDYDHVFFSVPRLLNVAWRSIANSLEGKRKCIFVREGTHAQQSHYRLTLSNIQPWMTINTMFTKRMKKNGWSFNTDDYGCMNIDRNPIPERHLLCSEFTCLLAQLLRDLYEPKRLGTKFPGAVVVTADHNLHARVVSANLRIESSTDPEHGDTRTVHMQIYIGRTVTFPDRRQKNWSDLDTAALKADMAMLVYQMTTPPAGLHSLGAVATKTQPAAGTPEKSGPHQVSDSSSSSSTADDSIGGSVFSSDGGSNSQEGGSVETEREVGAREG